DGASAGARLTGRAATLLRAFGMVSSSTGRAGRQAGTGTRSAGDLLTLASLCFGTSNPNSLAALRPRILRLACAFRNGNEVMELGRSKSQCGQSDANSNWVSALIASNVASVSLRFERSSGWLV